MQNLLMFGIVFAFVAVMIATAVVAAYLVRRGVVQQLPEPVRRQGRTNALICASGSLAVLGMLAAVIWLVVGQSMVDSAVIAFAILWVVVSIWFIAGWIAGGAKAGSVLLDCGPHPTRKLFWFNAAFFLLFFGGGNLAGLFDEITVPRIAGMVFGVTTAVFNGIMATGRLQIRENGIWHFWSLLRWERIESLAWEGDSLLLQVRTRFPSLGKGALPVPAEHKAAVDSLINERASAAALTSTELECPS